MFRRIVRHQFRSHQQKRDFAGSQEDVCHGWLVESSLSLKQFLPQNHQDPLAPEVHQENVARLENSVLLDHLVHEDNLAQLEDLVPLVSPEQLVALDQLAPLDKLDLEGNVENPAHLANPVQVDLPVLSDLLDLVANQDHLDHVVSSPTYNA